MGAHKIWTTLTFGLGCLGWEIEKYEDKEETADEDTKLQDCHDCTNTNITKIRATRLHKRPRMSGDGWILCWKSLILSVESVTIGCGYDLDIYSVSSTLYYNITSISKTILFWNNILPLVVDLKARCVWTIYQISGSQVWYLFILPRHLLEMRKFLSQETEKERRAKDQSSRKIAFCNLFQTLFKLRTLVLIVDVYEVVPKFSKFFLINKSEKFDSKWEHCYQKKQKIENHSSSKIEFWNLSQALFRQLFSYFM